jgi:PPOX class probable FMN-dependent enzyme
MEIRSVEALEAIYGQPGQAATVKVTPFLTPAYRTFVERSHFCVLTTVGSEGTDASPRGDDGPVVRVMDTQTLALPDWKGNERIDSLRNIVRDGRVSLMFFVQGSNNVIRVNGRAILSVAPDLLASFARGAAQPRTVTLITVQEAYSQCARALIRSRLWSGENRAEGLPTVGDMLREITEGGIDGAAYDAAWPVRAATTMW